MNLKIKYNLKYFFHIILYQKITWWYINSFSHFFSQFLIYVYYQMLQNKIYNPITPATRTPSIQSISMKLQIGSIKTPRLDSDTRMYTEMHEKTITPRFLLRQGSISKSRKFSNLNKPLELTKLKMKYLESYRDEDLDTTIDVLVDVMIIMVNKDNIIGMLKVHMLIAEIYSLFCQFSSAINVYTQVVYLSEICSDDEEIQQQVKVKALQKLGDLAHQLQQYEVSERLYKKILQYGWYYKDKQLEIRCYDKLGQLSFLQADLEKAQFYHIKSVWGRIEPIQNTKLSSQNIDLYQGKLPKGINHIDNNMLSKATFLPFQISHKRMSTQSDVGQMNKLIVFKQEHRFESKLSPQEMFDKLFMLPQFEFEISTPRQSKASSQSEDLSRVSPTEMFITTLRDHGNREELKYLKRLERKKASMGGFIAPMKRNNDVRKRKLVLDKDLFKQPMEKLIEERLKFQPDFAKKLEERYKASKMNNLRQQLRDKVLLSHLSPNRDIMVYAESLINFSDPEKLFNHYVMNYS
ncbi:hypothetical protein pb186bvf_019234 [Paramecium bursaria]